MKSRTFMGCYVTRSDKYLHADFDEAGWIVNEVVWKRERIDLWLNQVTATIDPSYIKYLDFLEGEEPVLKFIKSMIERAEPADIRLLACWAIVLHKNDVMLLDLLRLFRVPLEDIPLHMDKVEYSSLANRFIKYRLENGV